MFKDRIPKQLLFHIQLNFYQRFAFLIRLTSVSKLFCLLAHSYIHTHVQLYDKIVMVY